MISIKKGVEGEKVFHLGLKDFDALDGMDQFGLSIIDVKLASIEFIYLHSVVLRIVDYVTDLSVIPKISQGLDVLDVPAAQKPSSARDSVKREYRLLFLCSSCSVEVECRRAQSLDHHSPKAE